MTRAVLSLGSNLGDRLAHLQSALDGLDTAVRAVSPVFQTAPWGPVVQDDYLNAIVLVDDPAADGAEWLRRGQLLEQRAGRMRTVRFGPRTLDVDIITVEGESSDDPRLTLPHPRAHERAFVLVPWLAVAPDAALTRPATGADPVARPATGTGADPVARPATGAGAVLARPATGADPVARRVADLVAALPPDDVAGVRRRDDLELRRPPLPGSPPGSAEGDGR